MKWVCTIFSLICLFILALSSVISAKPYACEEDLIEVMFARDSEVRMRDDKLIDLNTRTHALEGINAVLGKSDGIWYRLCEVPEERLNELQRTGEAKSGTELYNMNNAYRLKISKGQDIWDICRRLEELPGIMLARPVPKPMELPVPPDFIPQQTYLFNSTATPSGINAVYAWNNFPGADGSAITVCDLEYGWNTAHLDVTQAPFANINPNPVSLPSGFTDDHGTAVMGQLCSDPDGVGTTGICYAATLNTCGTYYGTSPQWNVPGAIIIAASSLSAGDVILLEQQWDYDFIGGYIPIEWWTDTLPNAQSFNAVYSAIQTASANGIHVVEAGGNGNYNTDGLTWFGNSGATIVGAGGATAGVGTDRQRMSFSSYGNRFDLQGWGEKVVTTGYNDLWSADGKNYWYTALFNGTSSASPCVAGAMASCAGYWGALGWNQILLTPATLRSALVTTGTPQDMSVFGNIGPRPDIRAACSLLTLSEIEWQEITAPPMDNMAVAAFGVAWGDYDNDGDDDVYVSNYNTPNKLYQNMGGGVFLDVTPPPLADPGPTRTSTWADYDNDGDLDLYVANENAPNYLFRNDGGGNFFDATMPPLDEPGATMAAVWADYDNDGFVDLYLANNWIPNRLLQNQGGSGMFMDVTVPPLDNPGATTGALWGDYDKDGDQDLYILQDNTAPNILARNDGGGTFFDMTGLTPLSSMNYSVGAEWLDIDNNGIMDLYLVNNGQANMLFVGGGGNWMHYNIPQVSDTSFNYSTAAHDFDNDGDLDLYYSESYHRNEYVRNDMSYSFTVHTTGKIGCSSDFSLGVGGADIDLDGDVDLYVANGGMFDPNRLFQNKINTGHNWLHIKLVGTTSNKAAIGARVEVFYVGLRQMREISGGSGFCSQNSLTAEFGLGPNPSVDSIVVYWPSGNVQLIGTTPANQILTITETGGMVYLCGDSNNDSSINVGDAVFLINFIFNGGTPPSPMCQADANGDKTVNIGDAVYLINHIFSGGAGPVSPCCP